MIRNFATFTSDLPDDSVVSEGDIVVPAGRSVMEEAWHAFRALGFETTEIEQHSHYGWSFYASGSLGCYWLMIQFPEPWLLMVQDSRSIIRRLTRGKEELVAFLASSEKALDRMESVSDVRWYSEREWRSEISSTSK